MIANNYVRILVIYICPHTMVYLEVIAIIQCYICLSRSVSPSTTNIVERFTKTMLLFKVNSNSYDNTYFIEIIANIQCQILLKNI